jgi:LPXTG-motif cell wall-anchored protein
MNPFKALLSLFAVAVLCATVLPSAQADTWNKKTIVTFSQDVEVPGKILPAGTYTFQLLDSNSDRHIVQIFNADGSQIIATILAINDYRLQPTGQTVMKFSERPGDSPEALRAWFYPGKNWGDEFVYPKARAIEIAKITNTPVLFAVADLPLEVVEPIKSASEPVVMELKRAPIMAIRPTGEQVQLALVVTAPPPDELPLTAAPMVAQTLPATASNIPLIGLFGLMALGGAFLLRSNRHERSVVRL